MAVVYLTSVEVVGGLGNARRRSLALTSGARFCVTPPQLNAIRQVATSIDAGVGIMTRDVAATVLARSGEHLQPH
jgi:hypothetical protein